MKQIVALLIFLIQYSFFAQSNLYHEKPPVFSNCKDISIEDMQNCFRNSVFAHVKEHFKVPQNVLNKNYKGEVIVLFEVDTIGYFKVMYVDAMYEALKAEAKRVFSLLPKVEPATYNGRPTFKQYAILSLIHI